MKNTKFEVSFLIAFLLTFALAIAGAFAWLVQAATDKANLREQRVSAEPVQTKASLSSKISLNSDSSETKTALISLSGKVTEQGGAQVEIKVIAERCDLADKALSQIRDLKLQTDAASLDLALTKRVCVQYRQLTLKPKNLTGHWVAHPGDESAYLDELEHSQAEMIYSDRQGVERKLTVSAVGFCSSAAVGCNASLRFNESEANSPLMVPLPLGADSVAPLAFEQSFAEAEAQADH